MMVALALQDAVYQALKTLANGSVYYDVPQDAPLPYIYFGDDDLSMDYDNGGDFVDATANVEIFAADKIALKELVAQVIERLDTKLQIEGFDVMEWRVGLTSFRTMEDGMSQQASLEFDYLIQTA
ncbi:hypothetical protein AV944_06700 [Sphingomonas sp. LK11]|jgi:hypothetical protein|uniref:DUF3168 domain-containing protein n=1 Tax=Sphingomonas sp. LK11 TaxID=1390395 RepID=UPI000972E279|nr:DUF3168 domain-containing protein [Sphingomonas sp. LK11]APX65585.1 hypothetical protein AV944_06700 [Sphingomonas sp. LK11]